MTTTPDHLEDVTKPIVHSAPLLKKLTINCGAPIGLGIVPAPVLSSALFYGDLSSLHGLDLRSVRTRLPWRYMSNLTTFALAFVARHPLPVGQTLDSFESVPRFLETNVLSLAAQRSVLKRDG